MSEQQENLDRVRERIHGSVKAFCLPYAGTLKTFYADQLRRHVRLTVGEVAPGSPDRILRDLRQRQQLDYVVVSRKESLYRVLWVGHPPESNGDKKKGATQ